jgi:UDP-N-acetylglucosamine:LPS N-acetylglucosamine transferase
MKIAVIAEIAPAKAFVPIIRELKADVIGLTHGEGVEEILGNYCTEIHHIGKSRGKSSKKRSNLKIASLVMKDILNVVKILKGKEIDLILTCGNAGDVRKGISASKILQIPTLHLEQDIYNPIEMIAFANLITVPSKHYGNLLNKNYGLKNFKVIEGYPMASYVNEIKIKNKEQIRNQYQVDDFILLVFGGDLKADDIPFIIKMVEKLERDILLVPFRFEADYLRKFVTSPKLKVLNGSVELLDLMKASSLLIYGAGIGITIEAAVLKVPTIKLAGFHGQHASVDLAKELGITIAEIEEIPSLIEHVKKPKGNRLIEGGKKSITNVISIISNFENEKTQYGGFKSFRKIWRARSQFR